MLSYGLLIRGNRLSKGLPYLYALLTIDAAFFVLHILYGRADNMFRIDREVSYAESFQHLQEFLVVLLLGWLAMRGRSFLYFTWSLLFLYILLDDALQIHETLGDVVSIELGFPPTFGLEPEDLGELAVYAFFGFFFLVTVTTAYRLSYNQVSKQRSKHLLRLLIFFVPFNVGLDLFHALMRYLLPQWEILNNVVLAIAEDGSEMVVMSGILWFVWLTAKQ